MTDFFRSRMMTPADDTRLVEKRAAAPADCCTLDLEDGVHADNKEAARKDAGAAFADLPWGPRNRGSRLNHASTPDFEADIRTVALARPSHVVLSEVDHPDEVRAAAEILDSVPGAEDIRHVHQAFAPEQADLAWPAEIVRAYEAALALDHTATTVDGDMVDGPLVKTGRNLLVLGHDWEARFD